jgi:hypothetical protein
MATNVLPSVTRAERTRIRADVLGFYRRLDAVDKVLFREFVGALASSPVSGAALALLNQGPMPSTERGRMARMRRALVFLRRPARS